MLHGTVEKEENWFVLCETVKIAITVMVLLKHTRWIYAAAGSGIAIGFYNYLQFEKKCVETSWTANDFNFEPSNKWDFNWDKRELSSLIKPAKNPDDPKEQNRINEEKESLKPTAARHIILIRHGQYEDSQERDADRVLTPLGRKQADYVGQRLKELGFNFTKLTRSTMTRAIETSDIILKYFPDLPTEQDDLLREGYPITPDPPSRNWHPEKDVFKHGVRIEAAFRKYFHRADASQKSNSFEIIVCHANVIRYFFCRALQFPPERWLNFGLHHCSITWLIILPSGAVIAYEVGDFGFLPREAITAKRFKSIYRSMRKTLQND